MTAGPHQIVRASAGSGKTYALSNRCLRLLAHGARPDSILAITFTRKAAGEILGRVLSRLAAASRDRRATAALGREIGEPSLDLASVRRLLASLCGSLQRVNVSTIDSFFSSIIRAYRAELGVPAQLKLAGADDPVARQIRLEAIDSLLGDDDLQTLITLLRRLNHDQLRRGVTDTIDTVVCELHELYRVSDSSAWRVLEPPPGLLEDAALAGAIDRLRSIGPLLGERASWATAWASDSQRAAMHDWEGFLSAGIAAAVADGRNTYRAKAPLPPQVCDAYAPLVGHARSTLIARIAQRTRAMHDLLDRYHRQYERLRRRAAVMLFADMPALLVEGLPTAEGHDDLFARQQELYYRLDCRFAHLLLDEFQDTSPVQWRVLEPLAREIVAWGEPESLERSFFCVGDTKQAIYGWRGGAAAIFDHVERTLHLPSSPQHRLRRNWRTSQKVLDVVNRVFGTIRSSPPLAELAEPVAAWAAGFDEHEAARPDQPGLVRIVNSRLYPAGESDDGDEDEQAVASAHERFIADEVRRLHRQHPGRSIGVLVRRNRIAATLTHELRERGVDVSGEGGAALTDDAAVLAVLAALQLADHPDDAVAAFHVRHSPLGPALRLAEDDDAGRVSRTIRRRLADEGLAAVITDWARAMAAACEPRHVRRLEQVIDLADACDAAGAGQCLRCRDFIEHVRCAAVESPSTAAVRVMTVHKAKGLEFDLVVLAELECRMGDVARVPAWTLRPDELAAPAAVFAPVRNELLPLVAAHEPRVAQARSQEQARRLHDDLCALYVAMTRPRYALHAYLKPVRSTKNGLSGVGLRDASPAAVLRHALIDISDERLLQADEQVVFEHGDPGWHDRLEPAGALEAVEPRRPAVTLRQGAAQRSWQTVSPSALEDGGAVPAARLLRIDDDPAMARGRAVHAALASVAWLDEQQPALSGPFADQTAELLQHPAVRAALSRRGRAIELWRERPFAVRVGSRLVHGVFDRVEIDRAQQRASVIDFKTDRHSAAAVDRYRPQLAAYRQALAAMLDWPVQRVAAVLIFLADGVVVELEPQDC